jgi:Glyoxalase/Bleomycin resistance protein/Dioxygenase superfamily
MALSQERLFHVGIVVPDLDLAMTEFGAALGLGWRNRITGVTRMWTPAGERDIPVDAVYSIEGGPHVELIKAIPGTAWEQTGVHHLGYWSADVVADLERLEADGMSRVAIFTSDETTLAAYARGRSGGLIELINSASKDRILGEA